MIIDKILDEPPSYEDLIGALPAPPSEKQPLGSSVDAAIASSSSSRQLLQTPTSATYAFASNAGTSANSNGIGTPSSTLPRPSSSTKAQIKETVLQLLRTLITYHLTDSDPLAAQGILDSCATACTTYALSLPSLLQLPYIESHSVVYWALIKRPTSPSLAELLLELARPLSDETRKELRGGVLVNSDHWYFRKVLVPLEEEGEEMRMLLGDGQEDLVLLDQETRSGLGESCFVVEMVLPAFQKRMKVRGEVRVEFVAKGRLFRLLFHARAPVDKKPGTWHVSLSILGNSPSTYIDSRLLIPAVPPPSTPAPKQPHSPHSPTHKQPPTPPPSFSSSIGLNLSDSKSFSPFSSSSSSSSSTPSKPTISLRLRTASSSHPLVAPPQEPTSWRDRQRYNAALAEYDASKIEVSLEQGSLMGASLSYEGSSYLAEDGKLRARLEGRLGKPESDCVIC